MSTGQSPGYHTSEDEQTLHKLGYAQELFRAMGGFQNFAISFTIISILAGCLTSYVIAYGQGGPVAVTWGWLIVGAMSTLVALAMAEIASVLPNRRRPLLLGVEARQPRLGLVHGVVQPRRPDRRDRGHRLRARHLLDGAPQLLVRLPEHEGVRLPRLRGRASRRARPEPHEDHGDGDAEHDLRLLAHDRRRRHRRRASARTGRAPLVHVDLHRHGQRDRAGVASRARQLRAASCSGTSS